MTNGDKVATGPSWLAWLLSFLQAIAFATVAYLLQQNSELRSLREQDMQEIRRYNMELAAWRGSIEAKVNSIADDVSDIRYTQRRTGR